LSKEKPVKQLFRISIGAAGVLALLPAFQMVAAAQTPTRLTNLKLEGAWTTTFTLDPGQPALPPLQPATSLILFNRDGGVISMQDGPNPPTIIGTGGLGEWAAAGDNLFAGTVLFALASVDSAGNGRDFGFFKQRWTVSYNDARDQLSGAGQFALFDAAGRMLFQASGTITMKRIGVEPVSSTW
jgi:hypothetical protein